VAVYCNENCSDQATFNLFLPFIIITRQQNQDRPPQNNTHTKKKRKKINREKMKLMVKTLKGGKFTVDAELTNTVAEVKGIIVSFNEKLIPSSVSYLSSWNFCWDLGIS